MAILDELVAILGFDLRGEGQARRYQQTMDRLDGGMQRMSARGIALGNVMASAVVGGFRLAARGATDAVEGAVSFEEAMADVNKVVDATPAQMDALSDTMLQMSRELPVSADGLAAIAAEAGAAGVELDDLEGFTRQVAVAVTAFDLPAGQLGETMSKLSNVFGFNVEQVGMFNDTVNHLSNTMSAKAGEILNFTNRAAGAGNQLGLTADQLAGFGTALIAVGVVPETAARGVSAFATRIQTDARGVNEALQSIGLTTTEMQRMLADDGDAALYEVFDRLSELDVTRQAQALSALVGQDFSDDFSKLANDPTLLAQAFGLANDEAGKLGSTIREFDARAETTRAKWTRTKGILSSIATVAAGPLLDGFGRFADKVFEISEAFDEAETGAGKLQAVANGLGFELDAEQAQAIIDTMTAGLDRVKAAFGVVKDFIVDNMDVIKSTVIGAFTAVAAHYSALSGMISEGFDLAGFTAAIQQSGLLSNAIDAIIAVFKTASRFVGIVVGEIVGHFSNLGEGTALRSAIDRFSALGAKLSEVFGGGGPASHAVDVLGKIVGFLVNLFATNAINAFVTIAEVAVEIVTTLAEAFGLLVSGDILGGLNRLFEGFGNLVDIISVGAANAFTGWIDAINELFDFDIVERARALVGDALAAGQNIASSLLEGMGNLGDAIGERIKSGVEMALNFAVRKVNGLIDRMNVALGLVGGEIDRIAEFDLNGDAPTSGGDIETAARDSIPASTLTPDEARRRMQLPVGERIALAQQDAIASQTMPVPTANVQETAALSDEAFAAGLASLSALSRPASNVVQFADYIDPLVDATSNLEAAAMATADIEATAPQLIEQTTNTDNTRNIAVTNNNTTTVNQTVTGSTAPEAAARTVGRAIDRGNDRGLTVVNAQ